LPVWTGKISRSAPAGFAGPSLEEYAFNNTQKKILSIGMRLENGKTKVKEVKSAAAFIDGCGFSCRKKDIVRQ